jgi:hypothetical protein
MNPIDVRVADTSVHLGAHGDFTLWMDGDVTRLMVYAGEAHVGSATVGEGTRVDIDAHAQVSPAYNLRTPLLTNYDFSQHDQGWQALDVPNDPKIDVNGVRSWVAGPEGNTVALRLLRQSVNHEHGETGLVQAVDRNVSGFRHLWLEAWVRVDYADLSGGGAFGSEYPLMFRIKYEGQAEGSFNPWYVGMYYANPENRPILPNTAVEWPQGEWKYYRQDLMDTDPANAPYRLLEFAVMGQGHSYDARVAGVSLTGE